MAYSSLLVVCLLANVLVIGLAAEVTLDADKYAADFSAGRIIPRGNAANKFDLLMMDGDVLNINFCVEHADTILVKNVFYSNDGTPDMYFFELDGKTIGNFASIDNPNKGRNWNQINESGPIGENVYVDVGEHVLSVTVQAENKETDDGYGAEIDSVVLGFENKANGDLSCSPTTGAVDVTGTTETTEETTGGVTTGEVDTAPVTDSDGLAWEN